MSIDIENIVADVPAVQWREGWVMGVRYRMYPANASDAFLAGWKAGREYRAHHDRHRPGTGEAMFGGPVASWPVAVPRAPEPWR